jgi:hypothetical protein
VPATWLDIVDTAVKIGLGAAISGIATFTVTKYKFKSDKQFAATQRRKEALDQIAEHTEEFSHICLNYWARILDWTRKKKSGKVINETIEAELKRVRSELFSTYKLLAIAESKLLLLGEKHAQLLLRQYGEELTKFYGTVFIGEHGVSIEDIEMWRKIILEKRELVFNELAKLYQAV